MKISAKTFIVALIVSLCLQQVCRCSEGSAVEPQLHSFSTFLNLLNEDILKNLLVKHGAKIGFKVAETAFKDAYEHGGRKALKHAAKDFYEHGGKQALEHGAKAAAKELIKEISAVTKDSKQ